VPFRDAYKQVGLSIENGTFRADRNIHHTHEGSIGNLCNEQIQELFRDIYAQFTFERVEKAERELLRER